jgi:hypothetical protein
MLSKPVFTETNGTFKELPTSPSTVMMTTPIITAIRLYSIEVAPDSQRTKRAMSLFMAEIPLLGPWRQNRRVPASQRRHRLEVHRHVCTADINICVPLSVAFAWFVAQVLIFLFVGLGNLRDPQRRTARPLLTGRLAVSIDRCCDRIG